MIHATSLREACTDEWTHEQKCGRLCGTLHISFWILWFKKSSILTDIFKFWFSSCRSLAVFIFTLITPSTEDKLDLLISKKAEKVQICLYAKSICQQITLAFISSWQTVATPPPLFCGRNEMAWRWITKLGARMARRESSAHTLLICKLPSKGTLCHKPNSNIRG